MGAHRRAAELRSYTDSSAAITLQPRSAHTAATVSPANSGVRSSLRAIRRVSAQRVQEVPGAPVMGTPLGSALTSARARPEQLEAQTPVLLYPISVNNALSPPPPGLSNRDNSVPHAGAEAVSSSSEFTHGAILQLMEAMRRCWDAYSSRERSLLFQSVQKELEAHGHRLPVEKIRRKWNNLIVTYKRVKERSALSPGPAKTSWEYFEMMDSILGRSACVRGPAAERLVGFASSAAERAEDVGERLLPSGPVSSVSVSGPMSVSPSPVSAPVSASPSPVSGPRCRAGAGPLSRPQLKLRSRAEERTRLLRSFLSAQEQRSRVDEQRRRRTDARRRRSERTARGAADALGRMASALELISSKQDTIIALLQRLADRH